MTTKTKKKIYWCGYGDEQQPPASSRLRAHRSRFAFGHVHKTARSLHAKRLLERPKDEETRRRQKLNKKGAEKVRTWREITGVNSASCIQCDVITLERKDTETEVKKTKKKKQNKNTILVIQRVCVSSGRPNHIRAVLILNRPHRLLPSFPRASRSGTLDFAGAFFRALR